MDAYQKAYEAILDHQRKTGQWLHELRIKANCSLEDAAKFLFGSGADQVADELDQSALNCIERGLMLPADSAVERLAKHYADLIAGEK